MYATYEETTYGRYSPLIVWGQDAYSLPKTFTTPTDATAYAEARLQTIRERLRQDGWEFRPSDN